MAKLEPLPIQGLFPKSAVLGELTYLNTLDFYDRPLSWAARNEHNELFMAVVIDETYTAPGVFTEVDHYAILSEPRFLDLLTGKIPFRDAWAKTENGIVYRAFQEGERTNDETQISWSVITMKCEELTEEMLPDADVHLDMSLEKAREFLGLV